MSATASISIEVNASGALEAFRQINAESGKLGPTLQPVQRISEQTFNNIEAGALRARESAALLGEEFGVKVPRALRGALAESTLIGPALNAAFSGLALIGFVDIAANAGEAIAKFVDKLAGWSEQAKSTMDAQSALNKEIIESNDKIEQLDKAYRLIGLQGVAAFSEKQKIANEDLGAAKQKVSDLTAELRKLQVQAQETQSVQVGDPGTGMISEATGPTDQADASRQKLQEVTNQLASAQAQLKDFAAESRNAGKALAEAFKKEQADTIKKIATATAEATAKLQEMTSAANKGGLTGVDQIQADALAQIAAVEKIYSKEPTLAAEAATAVSAIEAEATRKRIAFYEEELKKQDAITNADFDEKLRLQHAFDEKKRQMEDETLNVERAAAVATAQPWERANVSIVTSYQERMDKIRQMQATGDLDEEHAARQQAAAWNQAFGQMRDNLASQMQGLFDDITSGNIGKTFKKMFEQMVFQMVAIWILGMQGMRSASQGAMGGGPGGILGAIFGMGGAGGGGGIFGGGGSGPGGTPPFVGDFSGSSSSNASLISMAGGLPLFSGPENVSGAISALSMAGIGLSAGQGAAGPGVVLPSGSSAGGAAGTAAGLGGLLTKLFPNGLSIGGLKIPGNVLAMGGLALAINGLGRGGILGGLESVGGGALTGFAVGGPIGALIGGAIGLISSIFGGLFGQHKGDKARIQVMEPLIAQIKVIRDSYDVFQTDYNTGVSELEQLRSTSLAGLKQIGGKQVSGNSTATNSLVNDAEAYLKTTEAERMRRAQINFGPAQFHSGGFVDPSLAGAAPGYFRSSALAFAAGGEVPAILHAGEFVMRESAVQRVGRGNLQRMNSGGGGGDVHLHMNVNAMDAKSFESWLKDGGIVAILKGLRYANNVGMM